MRWRYWLAKIVPGVLEEDFIPRDRSGRPILRYFTYPLDHYIHYHEDYLAFLNSKPKPSEALGMRATKAWSKYVYASWGFIAKGTEALPYVLKLLKRPEPESRETAAEVLAELGQQEGVVEHLIAALAVEGDAVVRSCMIGALGDLRREKAIPALARLVRDQDMDEQARWDAAESLGKIVGRRFTKQDDPFKAAQDWLGKHGY
jgi:hypothetical protein